MHVPIYGYPRLNDGSAPTRFATPFPLSLFLVMTSGVATADCIPIDCISAKLGLQDAGAENDTLNHEVRKIVCERSTANNSSGYPIQAVSPFFMS